MMKKNTIKFIAASTDVEQYVPMPEPLKKNIPNWYKAAQTDYLKDPIFNDRGRLSNVSLKQCLPFFDAMSSGYVQKTWCDIYVKRTPDGGLHVTASTQPDPLGMRDTQNIKLWRGEYYGNEWFWKVPYQPKTPRGYSVLVTHPMNRYDLPFTTLSGIIDSDEYFHGPFGNLHFYVKDGFEGMIPRGTPMFQYIPFERAVWNSEMEPYSDKIESLVRLQIQKFWGFYKENFWKKKEYY